MSGLSVPRSVQSRAATDASMPIGAELGFQPVDGEAGYLPLPVLEHAEAEDEQEAKITAQMFDYELKADAWRPIIATGRPHKPLVRFVDGSVVSLTAGVCGTGDVYRPLLVGSLGAMELQLEGRRLERPVGGYRVLVAAAMVVTGIASRTVDRLREEIAAVGLQLIPLESEDTNANYEVLRRRTWDVLKQEMEGLEREILLSRPDVSTLADGLLERRLTTLQSQQQPVVGMVKRNLRQYLPPRLGSLLYDLRGGQRSPCFVIKTAHAELVSWYVRLSEGPMSPGAGLVRLAVAREYLEGQFPLRERFSELSALSHQLCELRCRQESYARHRVSLDPIVHLEDQLHALLPDVGQFAAKVKLRLHPGRIAK